jgi:hypothetical protein
VDVLEHWILCVGVNETRLPMRHRLEVIATEEAKEQSEDDLEYESDERELASLKERHLGVIVSTLFGTEEVSTDCGEAWNFEESVRN